MKKITSDFSSYKCLVELHTELVHAVGNYVEIDERKLLNEQKRKELLADIYFILDDISNILCYFEDGAESEGKQYFDAFREVAKESELQLRILKQRWYTDEVIRIANRR